MKNISTPITECLLTTTDFNYIVALNNLSSSEAILRSGQAGATGMTIAILFLIGIVVLLLKATKTRFMDMDIFFMIPVVVTITGAVIVNGYSYTKIHGLEKEVAIDQEALAKESKPPENIELQCKNVHGKEVSAITSGDITLREIPNATESTVQKAFSNRS